VEAMKERRMFQRIEDIVSVKYTTRKGKLRDVTSVNISGAGIRLSMAEKLEPGTVVDLKITIPDDPRPFSAVGEVVWQKEVNISGESVGRYYDTGIKFTKIDPVCLGKVYTYFHQKE